MTRPANKNYLGLYSKNEVDQVKRELIKKYPDIPRGKLGTTLGYIAKGEWKKDKEGVLAYVESIEHIEGKSDELKSQVEFYDEVQAVFDRIRGIS